jgi:hypothetical protein
MAATATPRGLARESGVEDPVGFSRLPLLLRGQRELWNSPRCVVDDSKHRSWAHGGEQVALIFGGKGSSVGWFPGVEMRSGSGGVVPPPLHSVGSVALEVASTGVAARVIEF